MGIGWSLWPRIPTPLPTYPRNYTASRHRLRFPELRRKVSYLLAPEVCSLRKTTANRYRRAASLCARDQTYISSSYRNRGSVSPLGRRFIGSVQGNRGLQTRERGRRLAAT